MSTSVLLTSMPKVLYHTGNWFHRMEERDGADVRAVALKNGAITSMRGLSV